MDTSTDPTWHETPTDLPCPTWCTLPTGHPLQRIPTDPTWHRIHEHDAGHGVVLEAFETALTEHGPSALDLCGLTISVTRRDRAEGLDLDQARAVADALHRAADILESLESR